MRFLLRVHVKLLWFVIYIKQPYETMLITQYYYKTLRNCILEHMTLFPVPWPRSYRLWPKMASVNTRWGPTYANIWFVVTPLLSPSWLDTFELWTLSDLYDWKTLRKVATNGVVCWFVLVIVFLLFLTWSYGRPLRYRLLIYMYGEIFNTTLVPYINIMICTISTFNECVSW